MIRYAKIKDVPEMVRISKLFYDEMQFDNIGYRFDEDIVQNSYNSGIIYDHKFILLVSENDNILDGVCFVSIQNKTLYFEGIKFAQEIVWHSLPTLSPYRRAKIQIELLNTMDSERLKKGCTEFYLSGDIRPEFEAITHYLKKKGFAKFSENYHKGAL